MFTEWTVAKDISRLQFEVQEKKMGARYTYRCDCEVESHSIESTRWWGVFSYSQRGNQSYYTGRFSRERPTNEGCAVAVCKDIVHEGLCVNASILVTCTKWCENRVVDLKVN